MSRRKFLAGASVFGPGVALAAASKVESNSERSHANVLDFGAMGDGKTDDTVAFVRALAANSPVILVPAGIFLVSTIRLPSNRSVRGQGPALTRLLQLPNANAPAIQSDKGASNISIASLCIDGNASQQTAGNRSGVFVDDDVRDCRIEDVVVTNVADWGFFLCGKSLLVRNCVGQFLSGGPSATSVRAAFLVGSSRPQKTASIVVLEGCSAIHGSEPNSDGFILENGSDISVINCRASSATLSGFKIKSQLTRIMNCVATNCLTGIHVQGAVRSLIVSGSVAYRNLGSGFQFNQTDSTSEAGGWLIQGNLSIENGLRPATSTHYGFAFENVARCSTTSINLANNLAVDHQSPPTQLRGISFGRLGTFSKVQMTGNCCVGNLLDYHLGESLDQTSLVKSWNVSTTFAESATTTHRLHFWRDNVFSVEESPRLSDSSGGLGYLMPKMGRVRLVSISTGSKLTRGSLVATVASGSTPLKTAFCQLDSKGARFSANELSSADMHFSPGEMLTVSIRVEGAKFEDEKVSLNVLVEVIY